jgi:hypothetical protein
MLNPTFAPLREILSFLRQTQSLGKESALECGRLREATLPGPLNLNSEVEQVVLENSRLSRRHADKTK